MTSDPSPPRGVMYRNAMDMIIEERTALQSALRRDREHSALLEARLFDVQQAARYNGDCTRMALDDLRAAELRVSRAEAERDTMRVCLAAQGEQVAAGSARETEMSHILERLAAENERLAGDRDFARERAERAEAVVYEVADAFYGAREDMAAMLPEDWQCMADALRDGGFTYKWLMETMHRRPIVMKTESGEGGRANAE